MSAPVRPEQLAAADQELAATETALDALIRVWRDQAVENDRIRRVAEFMGGVAPYANRWCAGSSGSPGGGGGVGRPARILAATKVVDQRPPLHDWHQSNESPGTQLRPEDHPGLSDLGL